MMTKKAINKLDKELSKIEEENLLEQQREIDYDRKMELINEHEGYIDNDDERGLEEK